MQKRGIWAFLGLLFFTVGVVLLNSTKGTIDGAFIGLANATSSTINTFAGIIFMLIGLIFIVKDESIDDVVNRLHRKINELKEKRRGNPKYRAGLRDIEERIEADKKKYAKSRNPWIRGNIQRRLEKWSAGLTRRDEDFFKLPYHVKGVSDLPDRGLYDYKPLQGKKSRFIELEVTHYTDQKAYKNIKKDFEQGEHEILVRDTAGWAYFVADPIRERLETKELRRILGTGLQDYVPSPKRVIRNPESLMKLKIRVQKERVLEKIETYRLSTGEEIKVKKYAIAGSISSDDVVKDIPIEGARYLNKGLDEKHAKKEQWKIPSK